LCVNFVFASVSFGNLSHLIDESYGPGEILRGWINISLDDEPGDSLITGFDSNLSLLEFLDANDKDCASDTDCSCFPSDCLSSYASSGVKGNSKTLSINLLNSKLIGVKLTGNISGISSFGFNVSSNAQSSCLRPLTIDLLDDSNLEWMSDEISDDNCYIDKPYGCFDSYGDLKNTSVGVNLLCNEIVLPPMRGFEIGADLVGTGDGVFYMTLDIGGDSQTCSFQINSGGTHSCFVNLTDALEDYSEADVCISASEDYEDRYSIDYEDNETCGYTEVNGVNYYHDFEIFARPLKYASFGDFRFDDDLFENPILNDLIWDYIYSRYDGSCDPECLIPIRFNSGINQNVEIDDLKLGYKSNGLDQASVADFYEIDDTSLLVSSDFLKLDLDNIGIAVSSVAGNYTLDLKVGDEEISEKIIVKDVPIIDFVFPRDPVVLVPMDFVVILKGADENASYSYVWDFGDGTVLTTAENRVEHTYSELKSYELTVNVSNELGVSSKTFTINVQSPYGAINSTINKYNNYLENVKNQLNSLNAWVNDKINRVKDIEDLETEVDSLRRKYDGTFESEESELIKIMTSLVRLKVPSDLESSLIIDRFKFMQNNDVYDVSVLENFIDESADGNDDDSYIATNIWMNENLDVEFESDTYSFFYEDGGDEVAGSHVKIYLTPKKDIDDLYMIIDGDKEKIFINGDFNERELASGYGLRIRSLESGVVREVEFFHPDGIDIAMLPVYISPDFSELEYALEIGVCNNNGDCEDGESNDNCPNDCKSYFWTIILLIFVLIIGFTGYIVLQEWYKRYYERHLFKDKNQLFNLMSFMRNAERQKMGRKAIFKNLRARKWNREQLTFAWKKMHGKRTGMFEIPIFGFLERKKINKELAKRRVVNAPVNRLVGRVGVGSGGGVGVAVKGNVGRK